MLSASLNKTFPSFLWSDGMETSPLLFQCLNKDGVVVTLDVAYQYKARLSKLHDIILAFKDFDGYQAILKHTGIYKTVEYLSTQLPDLGDTQTYRYL